MRTRLIVSTLAISTLVSLRVQGAPEVAVGATIDSTTPAVVSVSSASQYQLSGSDGTSWTTIDPSNLSTTLSPTANATALLSGNADLWTNTAGYNQDLGIWISGGSYGSGQVLAWKESGGSAAYSPNAAFVTTTVALSAGTTYTTKLVWKANKADPGTIWAGAGPSNGGYSPTRLIAEIVPATSTVATAVDTSQYQLAGSDGTTWNAIDPSNLSTTLSPTANATAVLSGNADLWTNTAGYNQDLGIWISGGSYGSGQVVAWKESGGSATYSPNAAFVTTTVALSAGSSYTIKLVWKANRADPGTIWAGAGPSNGGYSPTRLIAQLVPTTASTAGSCPGSQAACMQSMLAILNTDRAKVGVAPLTLNQTESNGTSTCVGSYGHSVHMSQVGSISHDQFPADICIAYSTAGENVGESASGNELTDLQNLDNLMMSEPHDPTTCSTTVNHACNTINPKFTQVGIGIYYINNTTWLSEDFTN